MLVPCHLLCWEKVLVDISVSRLMSGEESSPFTITRQDLPEVTIVKIAGELDMTAATAVSDALNSAVRSGSPVIADCTAVSFGSSTVLGAFYAAHTLATKSGTRFALVTSRRALLRPLGLLGLLDAMTVVPDVATALRELELWDLESQLATDDGL